MSSKLSKMKKITLFSIPVIALIIIVSILAGTKGDKTKAANVELEEKLAEGGKLRVIEVVPDLCQVQFAYLVTGQEPIKDVLYSTDKAIRESITEKTDMNTCANIAFNESDSTWVNKNDFLGYVFSSYVIDNNGTYAKEICANAADSGSIVEFKIDTDGKFRYNASGAKDDAGEYLKEVGSEELFRAEVDGGKIVRYGIKEKIDTMQIEFIALTPAELDAKIAADKDYLLGCDLLCIEKGSYGHLETITNKYKYNGSHNPNATYGQNDFSWQTIEAMYEYAGKLKKPIMLDTSLSGTSSINLMRFYYMMRVMPYSSFQPIYENIDHTTGALNFSYTCEDPYNLNKTPKQMKTDKVTWDLSSIERYYLNTHGIVYSNSGAYSDIYEKDADGNPILDANGNKIYETYLIESNMDNLVDSMFFFKGEDISLGTNFKYNLYCGTGIRPKFSEVVDELDEITNVNRVTNASVLKYLLNLNSSTALRHEIEILEVEPSIDFKYATCNSTGDIFTYARNDAEVRELLISMGYLPTASSIQNVKVTVMQANQFANLKRDLTDFAFIYIGDNKGKVKSDLVYRFFGNEVDFKKNNKVMINDYTGTDVSSTGTGTAIIGGVDITTWIKDELVDYVNAKRVLMLGQSLYDLDKAKVDENSVMYSMASAVKDKLTVASAEHANQDLTCAFARSSAVPEIDITASPIEYYKSGRDPEYQTLQPSGSKTDTNTNETIDTFTYNFSFDVKGSPRTTYDAYIYIDLNCDGRFIEYATGSDESERIGRLLNITTNELGYAKGNSVVFNLPDNAYGMLPWKIKIVEKANTGNAMSVTGYTVCEPKVKKNITVLQIMPNKNSSVNLKDHTKFNNYVRQAKDYNISIKSITTSDFENWYTDGADATFYKKSNDGTTLLEYKAKGHAYDPDNKASYDYLSGVFDIIIIGFGDSYGSNKTGFTNVGHSVENLYDYAKAGYSVLMAHDVITYDMRYNTSAASGTGLTNLVFSKYFRDISGQDRYGYMGKYVTDRLGIFDCDAYSLATAGQDANGNTIFTSTATQKQATSFSKYFLMKTMTKDADVPWKDIRFKNEDNGEVTKTVQINRGSLTEYPYHLNDTISVAKTHTQWFDLNLEDESVTVWYTLAGKTNCNETTQMFNYSKGDAWSGYYVYTKNNITYTGAGHTDFQNMTDDEMKLFVNTIIASIRGSNNPPKVIATNAAKSPSSDCDYVYYVNELDEEADLKFIVQDIDLVEGAPIRNVKTFLDANGDGVYDSASDTLINDFTNGVYNNKFEEPNASNTSPNIVNCNETTLGQKLNQLILHKNNQYGENCIYISIVAMDAKGATGKATIKIKPMEMFNLD